ncbi:MAG: hypothetical protein C4317_01550 [Acidimicrobiia bacterium]
MLVGALPPAVGKKLFGESWCIGLAVLLAATVSATACGVVNTTREKGLGSEGYYEFIEPDSWWRIQVPRRWTPARIELDGSVTQLAQKPPSASGSATSPLRDPLSTEVIYVFRPPDALDKCKALCPAGNVEELAVIARSRPENGVEETASVVLSSLDPNSLVSVVEVPCPNDLRCFSIALDSLVAHTRITFVDVPSQQRLYQIKTSASSDMWPDLESLFARSITSFMPLRSL